MAKLKIYQIVTIGGIALLFLVGLVWGINRSARAAATTISLAEVATLIRTDQVEELVIQPDRVVVIKRNGQRLLTSLPPESSILQALEQNNVTAQELSQVFLTVEAPPSLEALTFMTVHFLTLAVFVLWPILALVTLVQLRRRGLPALAQVLWVFLIITVPILGVLAFWTVSPQSEFG